MEKISNIDNVTRIYKIDGITYQTIGWFGCQLESFEWEKPEISFDNYREILGYKFIPVDVGGCFPFRWRISWCLEDVKYSKEIEEQNALIREFLHKLRNPH